MCNEAAFVITYTSIQIAYLKTRKKADVLVWWRIC